MEPDCLDHILFVFASPERAVYSQEVIGKSSVGWAQEFDTGDQCVRLKSRVFNVNSFTGVWS